MHDVFLFLIAAVFACVCVSETRHEKERQRTKAAGFEQKLTARKLQGARVLIHWEVVQFQLALCIDGQPAGEQTMERKLSPNIKVTRL